MSGLEKALFNLKVSVRGAYRGFRLTRNQFTTKQLNRQAAKAGKDEKTEKDKLKKVFPLPPSSPPSNPL